MELRCSSEPSAMGLEAELRGGQHLPSVTGQETELRAGAHIPAQYMKLAASSVPMANHNHLVLNGNTGLAGGARVSIQSRPGSSQLVHIPEEENLTCRDQESESEDSIMDGGGSVREKWLRVAEKTTIPCRPLSAGGQPRLMQVNPSILLSQPCSSSMVRMYTTELGLGSGLAGDPCCMLYFSVSPCFLSVFTLQTQKGKKKN